MSAPTSEIGYASGNGSLSAGWWGEVAEEETPELRWPFSVRVYDRMRTQDTQVSSVLRAVTTPVERTAWRIAPAGARDEVVEHVAQDLGLRIEGEDEPVAPARRRGRFSWPEHLKMSLLSLTFGFMYFEQNYWIDDAGRARLRKLAPRMPRTISAINVARDGGLVSIEQFGTDKPIPVSRLVAYVPGREAGNWHGRSLLRPAYKNWLLKDRLLRVQAQTIQRNGMGVPVYEGAEGETDLSAGLKLAQSWQSGEAAGAAINHGAKLTLQGVSGTLPDADPAVRYHDEQIARAVLAHFLNLGTETGSWALGSTFSDFFTDSLQTVGEMHRDVGQQHIVEDIVDLNWGEDEPAPRLVFDEIGSRHPATAESIQVLVNSGAIKPDAALDRFVREAYGLPAADPATARETPSAPAAGASGPPAFGAESVAAPAAQMGET